MKNTAIHDTIETMNNTLSVAMIDSCEYILLSDRLTHKGNCKFCRERNIKILDSILKANLERERSYNQFNHDGRDIGFR